MSLVLLALGSGCASTSARPSLTDADYPGVLRAPASLGVDLLWRQRVTARWGDGDRRGFDAVVQKRGDTLTVMGLSPLGALGFAIVQRGDALELIEQMPASERPAGLPFPPRFILLDVQRALYPWLPERTGPRADGDHAGDVDGEHVVEVWSAGRLLERRFTRLDGAPAGTILVRYQGGLTLGAMPPRLTLENGWFGYQLEVETLEQELLGARP